MRFQIDPKILEKFKGLNLGVVIAKDIDNKSKSEEVLKQINEQQTEIRSKYNTETLSQSPRIDVWRKAYASFGAKPKENKSSIENLYRLIIQGKELRCINKLVDIYNLISLKHMLPAGGEDINKIQGDILLTFAGPNEAPVLLLGDKEPRPPHEGEVIYKDALTAICRRLNWRESDRTKFTEETRNAILAIEGLPPITKEEIEKAALELKETIQKFCGGKVIYTVLNANNPSIEF